MENDRQVVITGRGVVSPLGVGIRAHCEGLLAGRSVISHCERLSSLGVPLAIAGQVPEEQLEQSARLIPKKQRKLMNRATVLASIASSLASEEAGIGDARIDPTRLGVVFATWFTSYEFLPFIRYLGETESEDRSRGMDVGRANRKWMEGSPSQWAWVFVPTVKDCLPAARLFRTARGFLRWVFHLRLRDRSRRSSSSSRLG